jgi:UDP-N-acetylmuramoyl-L-alanyl-D-glutamate--2,6-diaminopimelate ligase
VVENDSAAPDPLFIHAGVAKIVVADPRKALAQMAGNFYRHPSRHLRLIGVTGTNGKTTTSLLIKSILEAWGNRVGLIGTIQYAFGTESIPATHTTPESLELNQLLAKMVQHGCTSVVMEVSSHSLAMSRVFGLDFSMAVFTNLTQDHLDFHVSMEEYFRAKKLLFDGLPQQAHAIVNVDDTYGRRIAEAVNAKTITFGTGRGSAVSPRNISVSLAGTEFLVEYAGTSHPVRSSLIGRFNVSNILAAYAAGVGLGIGTQTIAKGIADLKSVRGRFQQIPSPQGWVAVVDYAHTPDALENCLQTIRDMVPMHGAARVITVFGCGGNRDRGKRPMMGRIASQLSDITVITSDNPRNEDPRAIIDEIRSGVAPGKKVIIEVDRRKAIRCGLKEAAHGDVVLIAGKGHEDYQVIGTEKHHFDDQEEVRSFIAG